MAKLRFKYGTMNSSKTASLIMTHHNYEEQGKTAIVFKPLNDTKGGTFVTSRALEKKVSAIQINRIEVNEMFLIVKDRKPDCVLVDEVQFMPSHQIEELAKIVDILNIPVIAYGLMTDFQTNLFEGSKRLLEVGAVVEEIKTVCWDCTKKAVFNMRLSDGHPIFTGEQVQIGGNESYKPVCRSCYTKAKEKYDE